jgi:hypothetical protein
VTHQQAQVKKMKSKQQIKIKTQMPANPPPSASESMQPAGKPAFRPEKISIADSFLSPNPASPEKNQKKKTPKQKKSTKKKNKNKTKPKLQIISSNIKSKQQI